MGAIYISFTFIIFLLLYLSGFNIFDAFCHSLTTIATGGFSTKSSSLGFYNNFFAELIIVLGMVLASLPFTLYISCLRNNFSILKDGQVRVFIFLIIIFVLTIAIWLHIEKNINISNALRLSLFNSISVLTGTGFSTDNFSNWGKP